MWSGQDHPGVDMEGHQMADAGDGGAEQVYVGDEKVGTAIALVDGKEIGAAGGAVPDVIGHGAAPI